MILYVHKNSIAKRKMMKKITHNHIIFSSTLLYFVGIYVSDTIPYGKTMIVFALGLSLIHI